MNITLIKALAALALISVILIVLTTMFARQRKMSLLVQLVGGRSRETEYTTIESRRPVYRINVRRRLVFLNQNCGATRSKSFLNSIGQHSNLVVRSGGRSYPASMNVT